jgi:putative hemolysin
MNSLLFVCIVIAVVAVLTCVSFFLSACETALIGLSKIRLRNMLAKGSKRAQSIHRLLAKSDKFIATILIGNNFVNIAISAIVTAIFVRVFGYNLGVVASTFVSTFFVLVACEITPKILATKHTEKMALFTAPVMEVIVVFFRPITPFFIGISNLILRLMRIQPSKRSPLITEEELRLMIEVGKEEGVLSEEEKRMLHRIFEFGDTKISDVMVPKEKIIAVNVNSTPDELLEFFLEQGHARLPVYKGSLDNIIGIVYTRDLLYLLRHKGLFILQDLIRKAYFVSATLKVNELLRRFQADKIQIAVVVDDRKNVIGLVTLEDLLEEIVGELEEDTDKQHKVRIV